MEILSNSIAIIITIIFMIMIIILPIISIIIKIKLIKSIFSINSETIQINKKINELEEQLTILIKKTN